MSQKRKKIVKNKGLKCSETSLLSLKSCKHYYVLYPSLTFIVIQHCGAKGPLTDLSQNLSSSKRKFH